MISLILQTMGLSTEKTDGSEGNLQPSGLTVGSGVAGEAVSHGVIIGTVAVEPSSGPTETAMTDEHERIFEAYWREHVVPEFRCRALTKLFSTFLRCSRDIDHFFNHHWIKQVRAESDPTRSAAPVVVVEPLLSLKEIRRRIGRSEYGDSLEGLVSDVESCFRSVMSHSIATDAIRQAARRLVAVFRRQIRGFQRNQVESAIKSFSRASAKPDSGVAALIERSHRERLRRALLPSSTTLLVVPTVLVDHWMVREDKVYGDCRRSAYHRDSSTFLSPSSSLIRNNSNRT